jgi:hypothetical protein
MRECVIKAAVGDLDGATVLVATLNVATYGAREAEGAKHRAGECHQND